MIQNLFITRLYRAKLGGERPERLNAELKRACLGIAQDDTAGRAWAKAHSYQGYTSYASLDDLAWRDPAFAELAARLSAHVMRFARACDLEVSRRAPLTLDSLWLNVLEPGGHHGAHIHPNSVVSGSYYVELPKGSSAIKFEDPRLPLQMAAPKRKARARPGNASFVEVVPQAGDVLLWESYLRHEVPVNGGRRARISVSFNFGRG